MFDWTINLISLASLGLTVLSGVVFIDRANSRATAAEKKACKGAEDLDEYKDTLQKEMSDYRRDNDSRHTLTSAAIALIREQFVRKEDLQHLEASIARQFDALQRRLDSYFQNRDRAGE